MVAWGPPRIIRRHRELRWPSLSYDHYSPAYRVGYPAPLRRRGSFASLEQDLQQDWKRVKGPSLLTWPEAREATRAAWERVVIEDHAS